MPQRDQTLPAYSILHNVVRVNNPCISLAYPLIFNVIQKNLSFKEM